MQELGYLMRKGRTFLIPDANVSVFGLFEKGVFSFANFSNWMEIKWFEMNPDIYHMILLNYS